MGGKAKGILMQTRSISEDEAHRLLRERAMQAQKRLGEVAREVVEFSQWLGRLSVNKFWIYGFNKSKVVGMKPHPYDRLTFAGPARSGFIP